MKDEQKIKIIDNWLEFPFSVFAYCKICHHNQYSSIVSKDEDGIWTYKFSAKTFHDEGCPVK